MDADGGVSADFMAKLRWLDSKNSQHELSIEKFFDKLKDDKHSSAASLRSQCGSSYNANPSRSSFYSVRPNCKCPVLLIIRSLLLRFSL
jgi:alpha-1,3-glucan synthase